MFRLEKVFQNDDKLFLAFYSLFKIFIIYCSIYTFSILENNTIYNISDYKIYKNSAYYKFSIYLPLIYFLLDFFLNKNKIFFSYKKLISKKDLINFFLSLLVVIILSKFFNIKIYLNTIFLFLLLFIFTNLIIAKLFCNFFYKYLINKNIIQKNIMLVGKYENILRIIKDKKNEIYVYKCCLILDENIQNINKLRNEIKIPIFNTQDDVRSILEYHALGQIWILDNQSKNLQEMISYVIKFSVDLLIVDISKKLKFNKSLINNVYKFSTFEVSKFYGVNLFIKILMDKILSIFFLIILSPILLISIISIFIEDGFPIIFMQDRTGWDGRRFKIYKLRSLKNIKFNKVNQVQKEDSRLLKIGTFIRKFSIDEVPQFINVLKGDMSIVGPRPHMVEHDIYYSGILPEFLKRHKSNPGLTGWAQVNGFRGATPTNELMRKRMEMDLWYLNNWTPLLDFLIILKTFYVIFKHKGV